MTKLLKFVGEAVVRFLLLSLLVAVAPRLLSAQERGAVTLGESVAGLDVTARVLMIGAHPDDEDTQLITWLARGRQVETGYLSLTRGDGGQNLIGNELGVLLGMIRTEELLAARRLDGGRQFFTRAFDFGFSKDGRRDLHALAEGAVAARCRHCRARVQAADHHRRVFRNTARWPRTSSGVGDPCA